MTLVQGKSYRAYLSLPFLATQDEAKSTLEGAGFSDVEIYEDKASGKLCVQGTWTKPTQDAAIPGALSDVVEVAP